MIRATLAVATAIALAACAAPTAAPPSDSGRNGPYEVIRVVDGDTIHVMIDGQDTTVRFIGINTPETVAQDRPIECYGPQASDRTRDLLEGRQVWLEYDPVSGDTDRYGRTLAYVWLDDERMVNEMLVREGFAEEYTYSEGYRHQRELRAAERQAQQADAGLWGACP